MKIELYPKWFRQNTFFLNSFWFNLIFFRWHSIHAICLFAYDFIRFRLILVFFIWTFDSNYSFFFGSLIFCFAAKAFPPLTLVENILTMYFLLRVFILLWINSWIKSHWFIFSFLRNFFIKIVHLSCYELDTYKS